LFNQQWGSLLALGDSLLAFRDGLLALRDSLLALRACRDFHAVIGYALFALNMDMSKFDYPAPWLNSKNLQHLVAKIAGCSGLDDE